MSAHDGSLGARISEDLDSKLKSLRRLNRVHNVLSLSTLSLGGFATLISGATAFKGSAIAGSGPSAWRWTCGTVAVLTTISTLSASVHEHFRIVERLARTRAHVKRLRALQCEEDSSVAARDYKLLERNSLVE